MVVDVVEADVGNRDTRGNRHREGLDRAERILIVHGVVVMPHSPAQRGGLGRDIEEAVERHLDLGFEDSAFDGGPGADRG